MTRDEIIAKLAETFGPHLAPVPRDTGNPRRDKGRLDMEPDGNDEQASAMLVFRDTDGYNSMRPLTYGEIADALTAELPEMPAGARKLPLADDSEKIGEAAR